MVYCYSTTYYELPLSGFKIHISGTLSNYDATYQFLLPYLAEQKIVFKYIADKADVFSNLSKSEVPSNSGKLITIYPRDNAHCQHILEVLYDKLPKDRQGVYILGDRAYRDSNILFYRYGCFKATDRLSPDGFPLLTNGDQFWEDKRETVFNLPDWVTDIQAPEVSSAMSEDLANLAITSLYKTSNSGNIYEGYFRDDKRAFVMKEARSHVMFSEDLSVVDQRANEWRLSQLIPELSMQGYARFQDGPNHYYLYEQVEGRSLKDYTAFFELDAKSQADRAQALAGLFNVLQELLLLIDACHERQIVVNDLHPDNLIYDEVKRCFRLIDMDTSYLVGDAAIGIQHQFARPEWTLLPGQVADLRKFADLCLYLFGRLTDMAVLSDAGLVLKHLCLSYGLDTNIDHLLDYCLEDPEANAKRAMKLASAVYFRVSSRQLELDYDAILNFPSEQVEPELLDDSIRQRLNQAMVLGQTEIACQKALELPLLGASGVSGALEYLSSLGISRPILKAAVSQLLDRLVVTSQGHLAVKVGENSYSPYLSDGASGVVRLLLQVDREAYKEEIKALLAEITVSYMQSIAYDWGTLGVASVLLTCYDAYQEERYLAIAGQQLQHIACLIVADQTGELTVISKSQESYFVSQYQTTLKHYLSLKEV